MGLFVIAAYRPKPGKQQQLLEVLRDHLPILREQKLATDRPAYLMKSGDGTIIEVFEWKSHQAVEQAHSNPTVAKLWARFAECCDYTGLKNLPEFDGPFPNFEPVEL